MKVYLGPYPSPDKKERKVSIRIDKWDQWNADHTLALIIAPVLEKFKENVISYPNGRTLEEWKALLDQMIWSFKEIANNEISEPKMPPRIDEHKDSAFGTMSEFITHLNEARYDELEMVKWKQDMGEYNERLNEGLALFGKWYRSLWD